MIKLYKALTSVFYYASYPFGRPQADSGKEIWRGRLGFIADMGPKDLWIHAASVGETHVISYLIDYLLKRAPKMKIHVTVVTQTGFQVATQRLPSDVTISYFPYDAPTPVKRSLDRIDPRMLVIAETEIWPGLISEAKAREIPIVLVNGRMSDKGYGRYKKVSGTVGKLLSAYDRFFFKAAQDRERFVELGAAEERSVVAGDMKFDAPLMSRSEGRITEMRYRAGVAENDFLLVAGSTRPGEEAQLVEAYQALKKDFPILRLLLAPRHVERADEVTTILEANRQPYYIFGEQAVPDGVVLVNQMGLLQELYMAANLAFVGGTLVDIGGHNLLEPVWAGTPVLFGPSVRNVEDAAEYIEEHRFGAKVANIGELQDITRQVLLAERSFDQKTELDIKNSATATAGDYILKKLNYA